MHSAASRGVTLRAPKQQQLVQRKLITRAVAGKPGPERDKQRRSRLPSSFQQTPAAYVDETYGVGGIERSLPPLLADLPFVGRIAEDALDAIDREQEATRRQTPQFGAAEWKRHRKCARQLSNCTQKSGSASLGKQSCCIVLINTAPAQTGLPATSATSSRYHGAFVRPPPLSSRPEAQSSVPTSSDGPTTGPT